MKCYLSGRSDAPTILLLPGTGCHWEENFRAVRPLLEENFCVISVSYDGFDETESTTFPTEREETEKIEQYVQQNFGGNVCCIYGSSLGGSIAGLLAARRKIHADHVIIGSSDLDQASKPAAWLQSKLAVAVLYKMLLKKPNEKKPRKAEEDTPYRREPMRLFGVGQGNPYHYTKRSLFNQFYTDLITPLPDGIEVPGTTIHVFYALKMGEKYRARYMQHFAHADILEQDLNHEEMLICCPEQWVQLVTKLCLEPARAARETPKA